MAVTVFAVWEPVLLTDWSKPRSAVLARLGDARVRQFWDRNKIVANLMSKADSSSAIHPSCCNRNGTLWDLAAVYGPGAKWDEGLPAPSYIDGPVVDVAGALEAAATSAR